MSSMAKIFVVVNLAFGIVAFGSAATLLGASDDYRKAYEAEVASHKETKDSDQKKMDDLANQMQQQASRASEEHGRAETLQAQVEELKVTLAGAKTANDTLRTSVDSFSKELATANQLNSSNQEFLKKLAEDAKKATDEMLNAKSTLDKEIGNRVGLEQQVTELNDQVTTMAAEKGDLDKQLREANFWLNKYRVKYGPMDGTGEGSAGVVNAVKGNLVGLSVGSADKVRVGDVYSISRGSQYVGQVKITTVDRNQSVGAFDERYPGSGAPPQVGDKAGPSGNQ